MRFFASENPVGLPEHFLGFLAIEIQIIMKITVKESDINDILPVFW